MKKLSLLALLTAAVLLLSGCALITTDTEKDNARIVLDVNGETVTKGAMASYVEYTVQQNTYMNQLYESYLGYSAGYDTDYSSVLNTVMDSYITSLVTLQKAKELGLDQMTEEETAEIEAAAQEQYDEMLAEIQETYLEASDEKTEEELREEAIAYAESNGYNTLEDYITSETNAKMLEKLRAETVKDVVATEEELEEALNEKVESEKSTYSTTLSSYGYAVNNGDTVYYTPEGYRYVKQILIKFSDEDSDALTEKNSALTDAQSALSSAQTALDEANAPLIDAQTALDEAEAAVAEAETAIAEAEDGADTDALNTALSEAQTVKEEAEAALKQAQEDMAQVDLEPLNTALSEAQAALETAQKEYDDTLAAAYANIQERTDEVMEKIAAGEDFAALIEEYNEDPGMQSGVTAENGYAICENYLYFDSAFTNAAMALENVGDVTEPVPSAAYGNYIIRYEADIPEGAKTVDEVRDELEPEVTEEKQTEAYNTAIDTWISEADIKSYPEKFNY